MLSNKEKIRNNFIYFFSGELTAKLLGFLAIIFIARKIGVTDFGKLGFAEAFYSYFIYIGIAGVDTIATRDVARDNSHVNTYLGNVLSLKLMLCIASYLVLTAIILPLNIDSHKKYLTLLYGLCLLPIALSTEWMFQGIEKMKYIGLFRIIREASYMTSVLVIFYLFTSVYLIPVIRVTSMLAAVIFLLWIVKIKGFKIKLRKDISLWKSLLKQSYPILISQVLIIIIYNFSIILLGLLAMDKEIGYFIAIQKVILFFFGLSGVFWAVIFPSLSRLHIGSTEELKIFVEKVLRTISVVAIPIGFLGFAFANPIVTFLYGNEYVRSIEIFQILIWVAVFGMMNGIFVQGLLASSNERIYAKAVGLQACLMVTLGLVFIPKIGAIGASISWLLVEIVTFFLCKYLYNRVINFNFYRYLTKPVFASLMTIFVLRYFNGLNIIVSIISGILIYFIMMLIIKGIEVKELRLLYQSIAAK